MRAGGVSRLFEEERLAAIHRLDIHPHHHRLEVVTHVGLIARLHQHLAAREVDLVLQYDRYRLRRECLFQITVIGHDTLYA